jgi:hypothetical protein
MSLLSKIAMMAVAVLCSSSVLASSPCPNIEDIKGQGITMTEIIAPSLYLSYQISNFETDSTWGFFIAPVIAENDSQAIELSNHILSTMMSPGVPEEHSGVVICGYDTGRSDLFAAAVKDGDMVTPALLKQYFKKSH